MAELVTLDMAKRHLRITHATEDADIQRKLSQAHAGVLDFINQRVIDTEAATWTATIEAWDEDTVPEQIQAAILKQFGGLWRDRGDDDGKNAQEWVDGLAPNVARMLDRFRDPALA